jgi:AbrB family looped-hinge helix DNA binding protein
VVISLARCIRLPLWLVPFCLPYYHGIMVYMKRALTIDKAGRLVLPRRIRDALRLQPGDVLELEKQGDRIILSPLHSQPTLQQEQGIWVYRSSTPADASITELIDKDRESRLRELLG